ncbi:hypothetical protein HKBW3S25_01050 [Candidatus Hakubella thermalkaliphila]|uniref:Flotillin-like protein FloA n=1 Tax=Candidatus Hakubella thermalkaliphila TaxID=2754717 RepID=A0A6V8P1D5_9ACTN|nr:hypothetical protein HKBW3S25_01050 [Candidatus Hakubella thermalkaliphila]
MELLFVAALVIIAILIVLWFVPIPLWIAAQFTGVRVGLFRLIAMRLRRVPPPLIVNSLIMAQKAGLNITSDELEAHYLAGGSREVVAAEEILRVVPALISASKAGIPLTFERACAIDLAGRNVLEAVRISVTPEVIDCPGPTEKVAGVAMDGIELKARARVTVRANLDRLVGGAWTETVIARVGEGIVATIGSAQTHKKVLENPDLISREVLAKGLDAGTAFEILSIDIADVDVGENIGARLLQQRAEADLQIAKAKAEERRAMAVAEEQENKALVEGMRARLIEAESGVPLAIAEAFQKGNLGIMDYYRMKNILADTQMRDSIAGLRPRERKE